MKSIPVVLIIVISSITYNISSHCKPSWHHPFMLERQKEVWAETCYTIDARSVSNILEALPLPPLVTLSAFLSGRHRSLAARPLNQGLPILPPLSNAGRARQHCEAASGREAQCCTFYPHDTPRKAKRICVAKPAAPIHHVTITGSPRQPDPPA
ncbi:hypothetical protein DM01DRAFT_1214792 [Hesseltinella vesiculosa]|uniref:Hydrophobin n=1 Tax=Hesseltinella vesiculosa TaxID=101127 RepID=A0A1X2G2A2_9FUNG|nr:hypothetical protein DM01DRAFT_1214792 [Hesseltinella vesiculosa]